jgi:hypothetical protein
MMFHYLFICSLMSMLLWGAASPPADLHCLPGDGIPSGWKKSESPLLFQGSNLYGHINGGSELFLEFGFEELTVQRYRNGSEEVVIELYRMTDQVAAWGIYLMKCGKEIPNSSISCRHTVNLYQMLGVQDRYYFQINNMEAGARGQSAMFALGRELTNQLPKTKDWEVPSEVDSAMIEKDSLRLIRGPFALEPIYTLGEGDVLQLKRKNTALAGRYRDQQGSLIIWIAASYADEAEASTSFKYLRSHLDGAISVQMENASEFYFKDFESKFGRCELKKNQIKIESGFLKPVN